MTTKKSFLEKKDYLILLILTLSYSILSFYHLGDLKVPKTYQSFQNSGYHAILSLEKEEQINKIRYYTGSNTGEFIIMSSLDGIDYQELATLETKSVFAWEDIEVDTTAKYIEFISTSSSSTLGDVMVYGKKNQKCSVITEKDNPITDELNLVPNKISYLNSTYFDEIYYARSAYEYVHEIDAFEWSHPPLGKLIMTIPIYFFGFSPFTYRMMSNLFGILLIPLMYLLSKKIFKERKWAILGALLMMLDNFHFAHTRIALIDSFQLVFILCSILMILFYLDTNSTKKRYSYLILCGFFFGCSVSTKWNAFYISIGIGLLLLYSIIKEHKKIKNKKNYYIKLLLISIISFIIIPLIIYILSYLLFPNIAYYDKSLLGIIDQTKRMYDYHSTLNATHPFSSKWYEWPIMIRPVWLYTSNTINHMRSTIVDIGNPAIWWTGVAAFIHVLISSFKKQKENRIILLLILVTYLPYIFIGRLMFLYHYFITLPFIFLGIISFIKYITETLKTNTFYYTYIILITIFFILFYPVVSGIPISEKYIQSIKWLPTWLF